MGNGSRIIAAVLLALIGSIALSMRDRLAEWVIAVVFLSAIAVVSTAIREWRERREERRAAAAQQQSPQVADTLAMLAALRWIVSRRPSGRSRV
jgi:Zn-dependent protease with chaperone function